MRTNISYHQQQKIMGNGPNSFLSWKQLKNDRAKMNRENSIRYLTEFENGNYHENEISVNDAKMNLK